MNEQTQIEIIPPQADLTNIKRADVSAIVAEYRSELEKLKATADSLTVTSIEQKSEMKIARATRLAIRGIRLDFTEKHKELKADALKVTQTLDAAKREFLALCEPMELRMQEQEDFTERYEAEQRAKLKAEREAELAQFLDTPFMVDLSSLSPEQFAQTLADAKLLREAKIAAAAKEAADRLAEEQAKAAAIEAQRVENDRLKKLAEENAAALAKEREEAEKAAKEAAAKLEAERQAAAKSAADAAMAAQKEREVIRAKADAERIAAEAVAKKEREEAAARQFKADAEAKALRDELARKQQAERDEKEAAEKAQRAAAAAPDNEKLRVLASSIRSLLIPDLTDAALENQLAEQVNKFAAWVESKII